jgi:hypothetical protein
MCSIPISPSSLKHAALCENEFFPIGYVGGHKNTVTKQGNQAGTQKS